MTQKPQTVSKGRELQPYHGNRNPSTCLPRLKYDKKTSHERAACSGMKWGTERGAQCKYFCVEALVVQRQ